MGRNRQLGDGFSLVALCVREGSGELTYLLGRGPISNFAGPRANQRLKAAQLYHRGGGSQPLHVDVVVETRRRKRGTTVWLCWDVTVVCCGWSCLASSVGRNCLVALVCFVVLLGTRVVGCLADLFGVWGREGVF